MESLLHIKIDKEELVNSKKELLSTEADLIRALQALKKYQILRANELRQKAKFLKKLKEAKTEIKKLEQILPQPEIPKILKEKIKEIPAFGARTKKDNLEEQLEEIQRKLNELER